MDVENTSKKAGDVFGVTDIQIHLDSLRSILEVKGFSSYYVN